MGEKRARDSVTNRRRGEDGVEQGSGAETVRGLGLYKAGLPT